MVDLRSAFVGNFLWHFVVVFVLNATEFNRKIKAQNDKCMCHSV